MLIGFYILNRKDREDHQDKTLAPPVVEQIDSEMGKVSRVKDGIQGILTGSISTKPTSFPFAVFAVFAVYLNNYFQNSLAIQLG